MIPKKEKEHIYGLDGLRFFSFLIVVINHVYAYLEYYGFPHHKPPYVISIGVFAIQYFFAGSGFLITYILFAEKENTGTFHLGRFYMRRILRIWPGYYVLLLLTYLLVYNIDFFILPSLYSTMLPLRMDTMLLYFLFLPQIITFFNYAPGAYLGHTYTIGIEEQFYGIWALVFKFFYRYFITILVALFVLGVVLQFFIFFYDQQYFPETQLVSGLYLFAKYVDYSRITTFCMGSFLCLFLKSGHPFLQIFRSKIFQIVFYGITAYIIYINFVTTIFKDEFKNIFVCCLLLIAAFKESSIINYSYPLLEYLGKISYGVYLFHLFAIIIAIKFLEAIGMPLYEFRTLMVLITCSCVLAILFGMLSYHTIETFFLRFKKSFDFKRPVKSAENPKEIT